MTSEHEKNEITLSSHILDTNIGKPAQDVRLVLQRNNAGAWEDVASGVTDSNGRWRAPSPLTELGSYRMHFETGDYFKSKGMEQPFYSEILIHFNVHAKEHYHIPLLLSPHGYTTYRGS